MERKQKQTIWAQKQTDPKECAGNGECDDVATFFFPIYRDASRWQRVLPTRTWFYWSLWSFFLCCLFLDGQRSLQLCFYHGSVSVNLVFNALVYIKQFFGFLQFSFRSNGITWCKDFLMVRFFYCLLFSTSRFNQRIVSPSRIHDFTGFHELGSLYDHFYSVNQQCWFTIVCNVSPMFLKDF